MRQLDFGLLQDMVELYEDRHPAGGSLYSLLVARDWSRQNVEWCLGFAEKNEDHLAVAIVRMLLTLPDQFYRDAREHWFHGACSLYEDELA